MSTVRGRDGRFQFIVRVFYLTDSLRHVSPNRSCQIDLVKLGTKRFTDEQRLFILIL
jgi:hypothetical protein